MPPFLKFAFEMKTFLFRSNKKPYRPTYVLSHNVPTHNIHMIKEQFIFDS